MQYFSTSDPEKKNGVNFRDAVLAGLAPDGGLFVPECIGLRDPSEWALDARRTPSEIAQHILRPYVAPCLDDIELQAVCEAAFHFDFPLVEVDKGFWALELFHGPTLAFKDVGARFLAECMGRFSSERRSLVLVATSGDTGSAVANGFLGVEGVETVILYPRGKVSPLQEKQFASLGQNTTALAVDGTFDDCQELVKMAFADRDLRDDLALSSANSINIARWLPQSIYFAYAVSRLDPGRPIVISVPSGNLGNITAGIFAMRCGLPVSRWIAALNANDVVERYLRTGNYQPTASKSTLANAMDVGNPSNIARLQRLFEGDFDVLVNQVDACSFSDKSITDAIQRVHREHGYLLDPHGATGWLALQATRHAAAFTPGTQFVFAETAHPAKFGEAIKKHAGIEAPVPQRLAAFMDREIVSLPINADYASFERLLREKWGKRGTSRG